MFTVIAFDEWEVMFPAPAVDHACGDRAASRSADAELMEEDQDSVISDKSLILFR